MAGAFNLSFGEGVEASSKVLYKNLQELGTGGNASTFLVVATSGEFKGVPFAMKVFTKLTRPERRESFLQEIAFLRKCNHPSIMRVYDDGVIADTHPFVVAEYLPQTLFDLMRAGRSTTTEKLSYTLQLLSALNYLAQLHSPVIHRDIKPQNIFIKGRSCVLGDFGLLKVLGEVGEDDDRAALKMSIGVGMPTGYRTPDLVAYLRGLALPTTKSDVFQAGLVIAELFTGKNPLRRAEQIEDEVVLDPLGDIPGTLSRQISDLIHKMLDIDPSTRDSASVMIDAWQGIFLHAAKQTHNLEGKVF